MPRFTLVACLLIAVAACGGQQPPVDPLGIAGVFGPGDAPATTMPAPLPAEPEQTQLRQTEPENLYQGFDATTESHPTLVAMTRGEIEIYDRPGSSEPAHTLPSTTILGTATVLTAVGEPDGGWLEVMLPGRPNGRTGWIQTAAVDLYTVTDRIVVDLSDRELTYYTGNTPLLTATVAVGTSRNPTPTGIFFVTDSVTLDNVDSPWGPAALGLSGRSDTITEFNGGDGIIGIHGTNRPDSIGEAASLGCVRLPNDVITQLHELVPLGTPVEIRA